MSKNAKEGDDGIINRKNIKGYIENIKINRVKKIKEYIDKDNCFINGKKCKDVLKVNESDWSIELLTNKDDIRYARNNPPIKNYVTTDEAHYSIVENAQEGLVKMNKCRLWA